MRSLLLALLIGPFLGATLAREAHAQGLECPPGAAASVGRCETFHYHVQMYRPDIRQFIDLYGTNQFATEDACERVRALQMAANAKVVDFFRNVRDQQYEPDRFGTCHCDMTVVRGSPNFLNDAQRWLQLRTAEEIRLRVRERLLDNKVPTDSELLRGLWADPPATPLLGSARLVPMPQKGPPLLATSPGDLVATRSIDTSKPAVVALDLPLIEIGATPIEGTATAQPEAPATPSPAPTPQTTTGESAEEAPTAPPREPPIETVDVAAPMVETPIDTQPEKVIDVQGVPTREEVVSAQDTAERFIGYETQRIQNVLRASSSIGDENVKSKIFEACMQRIQILSNLRLLIEGSGMRSRLAEAARKATSEADRLALIERLFGEGIGSHWAPADAADVVIEVEGEVASAPERVLRDTTGHFTLQEKKHALYLLLAKTQPTEDQRLWLSTIIEGFLK